MNTLGGFAGRVPDPVSRITVSSVPEDWAEVKMAKSIRAAHLSICSMISISGPCRSSEQRLGRARYQLTDKGDQLCDILLAVTARASAPSAAD
jgi:hypothetical protein